MPTTGSRFSGDALVGAMLFVKNGCLDCHTLDGRGHQVAGAPDLSTEGTKGKGVAFQIAHLKCPSCVSPGSSMPSYASLGRERLRELASFLEAVKRKVTGTAVEPFDQYYMRHVPNWVRREHLPPAAVPGGVLFARIGCLNCHRYLGDGGGYAGAPDLSNEGLKKHGLHWQIRHLDCPGCLVPGSAMPSFTALGPARIRRVATFLEASRGGK